MCVSNVQALDGVGVGVAQPPSLCGTCPAGHALNPPSLDGAHAPSPSAWPHGAPGTKTDDTPASPEPASAEAAIGTTSFPLHAVAEAIPIAMANRHVFERPEHGEAEAVGSSLVMEGE